MEGLIMSVIDSRIKVLEDKIEEVRAKYLEAMVLHCASCMGYSRVTKGAIREIKDCCLEDCHIHNFRLEALEAYNAENS